MELNVELTQLQAKGVTVTGVATTQVQCAAPSVAWSAEVWAGSGAFKAGSAVATVSARACDTRCTSASVTRQVKRNLGKS